MSNRLKMAKLHAVIGLLEQKWSYRRIARELGVDRDTVARYDRLRRNRSKPAIETPGSETSESSNAAIVTPGSGFFLEDLVFPEATGRLPGRPSQCDPFREEIKKKLEVGLSAQTDREYQEYCDTSDRTATRDLTDLVNKDILEQVGTTGKGTKYILKTPQRRQSRQSKPRRLVKDCYRKNRGQGGPKGVINRPMTHITASPSHERND